MKRLKRRRLKSSDFFCFLDSFEDLLLVSMEKAENEMTDLRLDESKLSRHGRDSFAYSSLERRVVGYRSDEIR